MKTPRTQTSRQSPYAITMILNTVLLILGVTIISPSPCSSFSPISHVARLRSTRNRSSSNLLSPSRGKSWSKILSSRLLQQRENRSEGRSSTFRKESDSNRKEVSNSKNPLELASWYAVEAFGKAFGSKKSINGNNRSRDIIDVTKNPSSLEETLVRIQLDNERSYFLSGEVDRLIYDEGCVFSDPFVSFNGTSS